MRPVGRATPKPPAVSQALKNVRLPLSPEAKEIEGKAKKAEEKQRRGPDFGSLWAMKRVGKFRNALKLAVAGYLARDAVDLTNIPNITDAAGRAGLVVETIGIIGAIGAVMNWEEKIARGLAHVTGGSLRDILHHQQSQVPVPPDEVISDVVRPPRA